jgi:hypothetical protein
MQAGISLHKSIRQKVFVPAILLCLAWVAATGQGIPIGQWRYHLPNNRIIAVTETPDRIIGASPFGLVVYNKEDNSLEKVSKIDGLNDFGISSMEWAEGRKLLLIGYENGNVDIIQGRDVFNVPDIKIASLMGSKRINRFLVLDNTAYLACDFGIVELDLVTFLIRDTYYIGPQGGLVNVYDLAFNGTHFYAATAAGLLVADSRSPNLADFQNWHREMVTGLPTEVFTLVSHFQGKILANLTNQAGDFIYVGDGQGWELFDPLTGVSYFERKTRIRSSRDHLIVANELFLDVFDASLNRIRHHRFYSNEQARPSDALLDENHRLWAGDMELGLVREHSPSDFEKIILPGPPKPSAFSLGAGGGRIWVAPGDISRAGSNTWNQEGVFIFGGEKWSAFDRWSVSGLDFVWDIIRITVDPGNPDRAYASSWASGMLELSPQGVVSQYDHTNSSLRKRFEIEDFTRVGGVAVDRHGNVWVTNSQVQRPLSVKKPNGEWLSFGSGGQVPSSQVVGNVHIDQSDQKWVILHQGGGIFLFRENNLDSDNNFNSRRLTTQNGLPSNEVYSLAVDQNGYVWVGTNAGVAVFYAPQRAFSGDPFQAQPIVVEEQDGFAGYLFQNETVNAIAVDGSDKKWFATSRSGAFLLSADARQTIFHFTAENSPLPSNNILDIRIMDNTGEVFFATDRGLVSFRGLATAGGRIHSDVYAYPNPVRPHHHGYIAISGLVTNARVKITDINGNLVYETISEGGQAVWNGQDLFGRRPATGVYLVFSTNEDGSETMVTKIMFLN